MSDGSGRSKSRRLRRLREDSQYHWAALVAACLLGLVLSWNHWSGIVFGGAFVGILAADLKRAILSGIGFAVLLLVVWVGVLVFSGTLAKTMAMGQFGLLPVGIALVLSILGSLFRGLFP